jgi:hypothetical protein
MKHKTWFRLVIKAIGVYMLALYMPPFLWVLGSSLIAQILEASPQSGAGWTGPSRLWEMFWYAVSSSSLQVLVGLYLLFGGKWIVNLCIPSNRPYCPECGYQLSLSSRGNCPECGTTLPISITVENSSN